MNRIAMDFNWELYGKEFEIVAFLDNSPLVQNTFVSKSYYYKQGRKAILPLSNIKVEALVKLNQYDYDYIYIAAYAKNEIASQLENHGVKKESILINTFCLQSAVLNYPALGEAAKDFWEVLWGKENLLLEKKELLLNHIVELKELNQILIHNSFKNKMFQIQMDAIKATLDKSNFEIGGFVYSYQVFEPNPSLFFYECIDIILGSMDEEITDICFDEGPYEYGRVMIEEEDVVFDLGANYGLFSVIASRKASKGHVYAFEPISRTRKVLLSNPFSEENITVVSKAASNEKGIVEMDMEAYEENPGGVSMMQESTGTLIESMEAISIDEYVKEEGIKRIDFIKADIEGAERLMLAGAKETLKNLEPKLAICTYHFKEDPELLESLIKKANPKYVVEHLYKKLYAYVP